VTRLRREIDTRIAGIKSLRQQAIGAAVRYYLAQRGEVELLQDLLKYYLVDVLALTSEAQHEAFVVCELHYFPPSLPSSLQLKQRERIDKLGLPLQPLASEVERQRREDDYKSASERLVEVVEEANHE
jgi:hypothetical protein